MTALAPGTMLGKYRLVRLLGSGGMGAVWEAHDRDLDRNVALKVLRPQLTHDESARLRLLREARAIARLRHPNVIVVYDAAEVAGHSLIAMELVEGETLAQWLRHGDHDLRSIMAHLLAAGAGLAAAHAGDMVHRDFKPHNVLVDPSGRVVVTDFGLARTSGASRMSLRRMVSAPDPQGVVTPTVVGPPEIPPEPETTARTVVGLPLPNPIPRVPSDLVIEAAETGVEPAITRTGIVLGTPAYMAPEQAEGRFDARSDQYSFCVTAWEALAGIRPYKRERVEPPRNADRIPRRLRPILVRGLAIDPAQRYPSMNALLEALSRALRRPRQLALAGALLVGLGAVGVGATVAMSSHGHVNRAWQPSVTDLPTYEEKTDVPAISPDGKRLVYESDREGKKRIYVMSIGGADLNAISPPGRAYSNPRWTRDGKAVLAAKYTSDASVGDPHIVRIPLDGAPETDLGPGYYADDCGDAIVIGTSTHDLNSIALQFPDGHVEPLFETNIGAAMHPRCDRTGQLVTFHYGHIPSALEVLGDVMVVDRKRRVTQLTSDHASGYPVFAPDGKSIVYSSTHDGKTHLYELRLAGGKPRRLTPAASASALGADISPDGKTIAFNYDATAQMPFETGAHASPRMIKTERAFVVRVLPSRDRKSLLLERVHLAGNDIALVDVATGDPRVLANGRMCVWSADGTRVYFVGLDHEDTLYSVAISGGEPTLVAKVPGRILFVAEGPDGQHLAVIGKELVEAWRIGADGRSVREAYAGLVVPAPHGGWQYVLEQQESRYQLRFVAPNARLGDKSREVISDSQSPTWLDDHRLAYAADDRIHIVDVTSGKDLVTHSAQGHGKESTIVAADGEHWYDVEEVAHVSRHLITNFNER